MQHFIHKPFPFRSRLNLRLLVEYWESAIASGTIPAFASDLSRQLTAAPELKHPIEDISILEKNRQLVNFLMTAVISPANQDEELSAVTTPFEFTSIYETNAFKRNLSFEQIAKAHVNIPGKDINSRKTIHACLLILQNFYQVNINFDRPILFTIRNEQTGLDRVYKVEINRQFSEIIAKKTPPPIDPKIIKFLTEKVYDVDLWLKYIRPEDFEFHGLMIFRMVDVTEQEMLSSIKYDLLEKSAVTKTESFSLIQQKIRSIFGMTEIKLGLAYCDSNNKVVLNSDQGCDNSWRSLIE
jgi:hypothetical protein